MVLETVTCCKKNFVTFPRQAMLPRPLPLRREELAALQCMIKDFLRDGVVEECHREDTDYVSIVFLFAKRDMGDGVKQYRMIHLVQYIHFKMDSLESCLTLIELNCFMASIDMEDAYHYVPIHPDYTKYLKFTVNERLYKYLVLPQGTGTVPEFLQSLQNH